MTGVQTCALPICEALLFQQYSLGILWDRLQLYVTIKLLMTVQQYIAGKSCPSSTLGPFSRLPPPAASLKHNGHPQVHVNMILSNVQLFLFACRLVHLGFHHCLWLAAGYSQHQAGLDCALHSKGWQCPPAQAGHFLAQQTLAAAASHQVPALLCVLRLRQRHLLCHPIWTQVLLFLQEWVSGTTSALVGEFLVLLTTLGNILQIRYHEVN